MSSILVDLCSLRSSRHYVSLSFEHISHIDFESLIKDAVERGGADVNARFPSDFPNTPLAALSDAPSDEYPFDILIYLLDRGADPFVPTRFAANGEYETLVFRRYANLPKDNWKREIYSRILRRYDNIAPTDLPEHVQIELAYTLVQLLSNCTKSVTPPSQTNIALANQIFELLGLTESSNSVAPFGRRVLIAERLEQEQFVLLLGLSKLEIFQRLIQGISASELNFVFFRPAVYTSARCVSLFTVLIENYVLEHSHLHGFFLPALQRLVELGGDPFMPGPSAASYASMIDSLMATLGSTKLMYDSLQILLNAPRRIGQAAAERRRVSLDDLLIALVATTVSTTEETNEGDQDTGESPEYVEEAFRLAIAAGGDLKCRTADGHNLLHIAASTLNTERISCTLDRFERICHKKNCSDSL